MAKIEKRHPKNLTLILVRGDKPPFNLTLPFGGIFVADLSILHTAIDWVQARMKERTSWDGLTIIVISILVIIASPLVKIAAWVGLAYGVWTVWKKERKFF